MDPVYVSELNRDVTPAAPGEFAPMLVGPLPVWPPVVLAPMAGVTNSAFRSLCRRHGAGLYVAQMVTARALVERRVRSLELAEFGADESPRSIQLYGTDPATLAEAVRFLVGEGRVDHIDMNFGCPMAKVTRHGGGSAILAKPRLLARIVAAAVGAAAAIPVTIKFRLGVDSDHLTYLDTGRIAEAEGAGAVSLHARTAEQLYSGHADWNAIGELKQAVTSIPVLGNGDIWEPGDALRMMRTTGCDGVVVGRGCLGRPWLFGQIAAMFDGREPGDPPTFGAIASTMTEHLQLLIDLYGEARGLQNFRKHTGWYLQGFPVGGLVRRELNQLDDIRVLRDRLAAVDPTMTFPPEAVTSQRGHSSGPQRVMLPAGWLDDPQDDTSPSPLADAAVSGG